MKEADFGKGGAKDNLLRSAARSILLPSYDSVATASAPFDWNAGYDAEQEIADAIKAPGFRIPVKNQNGSGSCGGQAMAYYVAAIEAVKTKVFSEKSAKYEYSPVRAPGGGTTHSALVGRAKGGICTERLCPSYDNGNPPSEEFMSQPVGNREESLDAATSVVTTSFPVTMDIDLMAQAIRDNRGIKIGITGQNNGTWLSSNPAVTDLSSGIATWNHWLWIGKATLINGKKTLFALNSWGSSAGDQGWQQFGEEWVKSGFIWQADALVDNRDKAKMALTIQTELALLIHDLTL